MRRLLTAIVLAVPSETKFVMQLQFGIMILSSVSYLAYLIIVKPYKRNSETNLTNKFNNNLVILHEVCYLALLLLLAFTLFYK